jgi:hypothetical protein
MNNMKNNMNNMKKSHEYPNFTGYDMFASTETPLVLTGKKKKHPHLSNLATGTIPISGSVNEITTGGVSLYLVLTHIVTISSLLLFLCETSGFLGIFGIFIKNGNWLVRKHN